MIESITTNIFIIFTYFIPGALFLVSLSFFVDRPLEKIKLIDAGKVSSHIYLAIVSLFIGIILHAGSHGLLALVNTFIYDYHKAIRLEVKKNYKIEENTFFYLDRQLNIFENEIDYLYVLSILKEKTVRTSDTLFRLEALTYLSRNCIIPLVFATFGLFYIRYKQKIYKWPIILLALPVAISIPLLGYLFYLMSWIEAVVQSRVLLLLMNSNS